MKPATIRPPNQFFSLSATDATLVSERPRNPWGHRSGARTDHHRISTKSQATALAKGRPSGPKTGFSPLRKPVIRRHPPRRVPLSTNNYPTVTKVGAAAENPAASAEPAVPS